MILTKRFCVSTNTTITLKSFLIATLFISALMANCAEAAKLRRNNKATAAPAAATLAATTTSTKTTTTTTTDLKNESNAAVASTQNAVAETNFTEAETETLSNEKETATTAAAAVQPVAAAAEADDAITTDLSIWGIVRSVWNWIRIDLSESILSANDDEDEESATASGSSALAPATGGAVGRTFGKIRRLQMALIPIIFKFGVLSAMVAFLVVLGMKTLFLLKILILMNAAAILGKFLTLKTNFGSIEHHHIASPPPAAVSWGYSNWNDWSPPHRSSHGWGPSSDHRAAPPAPNQPPSKEIHLHIHGAQTQPQISAYSTYGSHNNGGGGNSNGGWERRSDSYHAYDATPISVISDVDIENELNNQGPLAALPTKYPANHRY